MADEFDDLEAEADQWLGENPDHRASALIKQLRASVKRADKRGYDRAVAEATAQKARDEAFAKIPAAVRPLFKEIDPTDTKAIQEQIGALKALGLNLDTEEPAAPQAPTQQQPPQQQQAQSTDQLAVAAMQQLAAGGTTTEPAGDLATRMQAMQANPGKYTDEQIQATVNEYNQAVVAASRQGTSGALG